MSAHGFACGCNFCTSWVRVLDLVTDPRRDPRLVSIATQRTRVFFGQLLDLVDGVACPPELPEGTFVTDLAPPPGSAKEGGPSVPVIRPPGTTASKAASILLPARGGLPLWIGGPPTLPAPPVAPGSGAALPGAPTTEEKKEEAKRKKSRSRRRRSSGEKKEKPKKSSRRSRSGRKEVKEEKSPSVSGRVKEEVASPEVEAGGVAVPVPGALAASGPASGSRDRGESSANPEVSRERGETTGSAAPEDTSRDRGERLPNQRSSRGEGELEAEENSPRRERGRGRPSGRPVPPRGPPPHHLRWGRSSRVDYRPY